MRERSYVQSKTPDLDRRQPFLLAHDIRNGYALRAEALRDPDMPLAANHCAWRGRLAQYAIHGNFRGVKAIIHTEIDAKQYGLVCGFRNRHPAKVRNRDLSSVNCKMHRGNGCQQRHERKHQYCGSELEKSDHTCFTPSAFTCSSA